MRKLLCGTALAVLGIGILIAAPGPCPPVATYDAYLGAINSQNGCTIGPLLFSQFSWDSHKSGPAVLLQANQLQVAPLVNPFGTGFLFQPGVVWTANPTGYADIEVNYVVSSISGAKIIGDLYTAVGGIAAAPSSANLTELYSPGGTTLPPANPTVLWVPAGGSAARVFPATNSVAVLKDIALDARAGGPATITSVSSQFSLRPFAIRVRAGGGAYTDTAGNVWDADNGFVYSGAFSDTYMAPPTTPIANTADPALYRGERYGWNPTPWGGAIGPRSFQYQFTVPAGSYTVNLKFSENFVTSAGQRVFDVLINSAPVLVNFDIFAAAPGGFRAIDKAFPIITATGQITIEFNPAASPNGAPKIDAIEIF